MCDTAFYAIMVNNNHIDNYLKEILVFVYYGSIVNKRPKKNDYITSKQRQARSSSASVQDDQGPVVQSVVSLMSFH